MAAASCFADRAKRGGAFEAMVSSHVIEHWDPEDSGFWRRGGRRVARRNLWLSVAALTLAFSVWMLWSVVVVHLPAVGFRYSTNQLFWLAALPALAGATLRLVYAFAVPLFGGRRWTAMATASLLLPALGIGLAVQNPATPYEVMVLLALLCGLGGGNFASSMAHISYFFPKRQLGFALGLNAGLGNAGLALVQLVVPLVIGVGLLGALGGMPQHGADGQPLWLQNAGFVWVPFIVAASLAAWFGMNDLADAASTFSEQAVVVLRKHTWLMSWLYIGTFGSFIGYSAAFPLLLANQFPAADLLALAWVGPLLGALLRPLGGWLSDRLGGARVTLWVFGAMIAAVLLVLNSLPQETVTGAPFGGSLAGVLLGFAVLFAAAGIGSGSTFRMIPLIFVRARLEQAGADPAAAERARREGHGEAAAALGLTSALGAYGGFFIPKSFGTSIALTGAPLAALWVFVAFYFSCIAVTWWFYARRFALIPC
jgi:NNP family nitrate/nitrite transporter-like MFS transporter